MKKWTEEETLLLTLLYNENKIEPSILQRNFPDRTLSSIQTKAYKLKLSRSREWTQDQIDSLISLREQGYPISQVSNTLGRTQGATEKKVQELIASGIIQRKRLQTKEIPWTEDEVSLLIYYYYDRDFTSYEVSDILERTEPSVRGKIERLRSSGDIPNRKKECSGLIPWSTEDETKLINLVNEHKSTREICIALERGLGSVSAKIVRLRSNGVYLEDRSTTSTRSLATTKDRTTYVYLIHFNAEDFYKIGITQNKNISRRFPKIMSTEYQIIDTVKCDSVIDALAIEHSVLMKMQSYKFLPEYTLNTSGGKTECFKLENKPSSIQDIIN